VIHRRIATNGIELHVAEEGDGPLVVLCHGWPELWYSWRHQLPVLAGAGYRVIAPDQRGYGGSDRPEAVAGYDVVHLTDDLLGLLDAYGEDRATFVGHDWGASVVWALARRAPERVERVAALSVPFRPRASRPPTEILKQLHGDRFFYMLYFQAVGPADAELGQDPELTLRRVLWGVSGDAPPDAWVAGRKGDGMLGGMAEPERLPAWLGAEDLAYYTAEFSRTGFTGGLNWYRNLDRNWEQEAAWDDVKIETPALFVAGERDPVLRFIRTDAMDEWVPGLRRSLILPGAGHWIQQERPAEVNEALLAFLQGEKSRA
jgi:pimeloyl-ACP methyl ester carboxylesterase